MRLNDEQIAFFVQMKDEDITLEHLTKLFGRTEEQPKPKYEWNDWFYLKPGMIKNYKGAPVITTVGRFIINRFLLESVFGDKFDYVNEENLSSFEDKLDAAIIRKQVDLKEQVPMYINKRSWIEHTVTEIAVPGADISTFISDPVVMKRKDELCKIHKKELDAGNAVVAEAIEKELIALTVERNKNNPAFRFLMTKKPNLHNQYKNMILMVGARKSNVDGTIKFTKSSFSEGIEKEEFAHHSDQLVGGTFGRSVGTKDGGAETKKWQAALQTVMCDTNVNSDCGTTKCINVTLTANEIKNYYMWRYVRMPNGKLVQIEPENYKEFADKPISLRTPLFCKRDKFCAKCAGGFFAMVGLKNIGLVCQEIPVSIQELDMQAFHDTTFKTTPIDFVRYFEDY